MNTLKSFWNNKKDNADISIGVKFEKETCTIVADFGCFV